MVGETESRKKNTPETIKFLCSYEGKILPRSTDGMLRYVGGLTRVLSVDRSISYAELMVKLGEFCGYSVTLRCQLPDGDLETLVSIKSDEELANLIEEYRKISPNSKIRAILSQPKSLKQISPPPSINPSLNYSFSSTKRRSSTECSPRAYYPFLDRTYSPPLAPPVVGVQRVCCKACCHQHYYASPYHWD